MSVARVGFHDFEWFGDADLEWVVTAGQNDKTRLSQEIAAIETEIQGLQFGASKGGGKRFENQQRELDTKQRKLRELEQVTTPYEAEFQSRRPKGEAGGAI
jgi:hypothetical protein